MLKANTRLSGFDQITAHFVSSYKNFLTYEFTHNGACYTIKVFDYRCIFFNKMIIWELLENEYVEIFDEKGWRIPQ